MVNTIYKYELSVEKEQRLILPLGSRILSVGVQNNFVVLWAEVDRRQTTPEIYIIYTYGTGHDISRQRGKFIGTCLMMGGALVWHVYARKE